MEFSQDFLDRLIHTKNPDGGHERLMRDGEGNVLMRVHPNAYDSCRDDGEETAYVYDLCGNRLKKLDKSGTEEYHYNRKNQLIGRLSEKDKTAYRYDQQGNLLKAAGAEGTTSYTYNAFNQQTAVLTADGGKLENQYDAEYLRAGTIENGEKRTFLYYQGELIAEADKSEEPISRYILGYGVAAGWNQGREGYYSYHLDEQNSTAYILGAGGEIENVYQYEDGLKAFIEEVNQDHTPMHDPISFRGESNQIIVEGCFQYTDEYQENIFSFTNMVRTRDGGSHETGAKQAFTKVFNEYARKNGFLKEKDKGFDGNDVREGLTLVINLTIPEDYLQFEGQTKEKLGTPEAKPATETVVSENLRYFLEENKEVANALVRKIIKAAQARNAARKARADIRNGKGKNRSERVLSGKLASAQSKDARRKELYLVEGDSAGGSAKQGRDSKYQAILPLRGKVLNTEKASLEAIEKNEELNTIIHALGAGVGANFTAEDSNYYKVIIMTDADDDGAHIQNLLLTFFYRYMRDLITHEMLYIALPPLYRIAKAGKEYYLYTNEELDEKKAELKNGYTITRYKGLGEMNATQLWDTTMNPESRTLLCVTIENAMMAEKRVTELMGDKAELRRNWIEDNVVFTLEDDYKEVNA